MMTQWQSQKTAISMTARVSISPPGRNSTARRKTTMPSASYMLKPEDCENIHRDMPAFGLGGAVGLTPATARIGGLRDPFPRS